MRIAIGGQMNKREIKAYVDGHSRGGEVTCDIFTDTEAAMKVRSGEFDYYVGACQSGAGGALAMAYGVLGRDKCATIGMCGIAPKEAKVIEAIERGCKAFGFTNEQVEPAMALLLKHLP